MNINTIPNEINFFLRDDEYGFLSNFWRAPQTIDELVYPTNEHFYQAQKTNNSDVYTWILSAPTPYLAMRAGRSLRKGKELRDDWCDEIRIETMLVGLRAKFTQNPDLKEKLLATGDVAIHEDAPSDMFWGRKGKDMLGKLLMQVREELRRK